MQALPGNLELHEADLLKEGSFDGVIQVWHHTLIPVLVLLLISGKIWLLHAT